ncbi:MAG: Trans-aconitate methyltransferase [Chloroflexi bacterium]|jgi:ubiquinone/menaquinone biosynthesis C-methylase UbiE|nr:MAG: Trans-aconitate methyltransferase [Chloroflexota bacterium]
MLVAMSDAASFPHPSAWDAQTYADDFSFVAASARDLIEWLGPQSGEKILDLGCGTGALSATIAESGAVVEGVDQDASMLALAAREHPGIAFRQADGQALRVDAPLDAVFSNAALHWMPDQDAVVRSVAAALRPGGRFVAEMGGKRNIAAILAPLRAAMAEAGVPVAQQPQPWVFPSPAEQASRLEAQGFEVRRLAYFDRPSPFEGGMDGMRGWLQMFARAFSAVCPADRWEQVVRAVEDGARDQLFDGERWVGDYVRLRFLAQRV